jgi:selenocysteine-specific elongation factor
LVVAADEGVKPQTREHVAICSLLGIPACLVALTKSDLVAEDVLELARMEVEELLAPTPFAGAHILPISSLTGDGMEQMRSTLVDLAEEHEALIDPDRPARLPVDRAFHLKGLGVVITGTLVSGRIRVGDSLQILPTDGKARVRSIQVHGSSRQEASAGERTALQLTGASRDELQRGVQLTAPGSFQIATSLVGSFTLLEDAPKAIKGSIGIRFHLYSSEVQGRLRPLDGPLEPGGKGAVEIRLARPVVAVRGDRFVIRRPSPPITLGGGEVLDPAWRRHRGSQLTSALEALTGSLEDTLGAWLEDAGEAGQDTQSLARRLGVEPDAVESAMAELVAAQKALRVPTAPGRSSHWLDPGAYRRVAKRAEKVLKAYFRRERLSQGMPKAEAIDRTLPGQGASLADVYLSWLEAQEILVVTADSINLPGRSAELTQEESGLALSIVEEFDGAALRPPPPAEIRDKLDAKPQIFDGVVQYLLRSGKLIRLPGGLLISAKALQQASEELRASDWESFTVGDFKEQHGLTRKWAIPILEHLDSSGVTRRVGDARQVVRTRR